MHQSDQRRAPGHLSRQGPPALRWALFEAAQVARRPGSPDRDYYLQSRRAARRATAPAWRSRASCSNAATTRCASSARRRCNPPEPRRARAALHHTDASRPAPAISCRHARVDGPERPSGRNAYPRGITPSTIMSPTRSHPGPWTEIRPGARAHTPSASAATAPVKRFALGPQAAPGVTGRRRRRSISNHRSHPRPLATTTRIARLPRGPCTDKGTCSRDRDALAQSSTTAIDHRTPACPEGPRQLRSIRASLGSQHAPRRAARCRPRRRRTSPRAVLWTRSKRA